MDLKEASKYRIIEKYKKGKTTFFIQNKIFDKWLFIRDKRGIESYIALFCGVILFLLWAYCGFETSDGHIVSILFLVGSIMCIIGSLLWILVSYCESGSECPHFKKNSFEDYQSAENYVKELVAEKVTKREQKKEGEHITIHMLDIRIERKEKLNKLNKV